MKKSISFWLNDSLVHWDGSMGLAVLDYLRRKKKLRGTKEGCKEGDCGACTVLVGRFQNGKVDYQIVTSCLLPVGELQGKHLVTIEGLNMESLSPVQRAMVDQGGSQCGYCTPGFVVSMTWYLLSERREPSLEGFKRAISGNLCRCTGYQSIKRSATNLVETFQIGESGEKIWQAENRIQALVEAEMMPPYFTEMARRLADIAPLPEPPSDVPHVFVAGGTDLYVQQGATLPRSSVHLLHNHPEWKGVVREKNRLIIGALTTFEEFSHDPEVQKIIPSIERDMLLIASLPIRNRATLGGNLVNGSPIGDMTILFLALDCAVVLQDEENKRVVSLRNFYKGYKDLDRHPKEILTHIYLPIPPSGTKIHFEKVSKRKYLDIASVNSVALLRVHGEGVVESAALSFGGVAPIPFFARATSNFLRGKTISAPTLRQAGDLLQGEISPISDIRGGAEYKTILARQLLLAHFVDLYPDRVNFEEICEIS